MKAAGKPMRGQDFVSRLFVGFWPRFMAQMDREFVAINGSPGFLIRSHDQIHYVFSFEISQGRVCNLYIISNPDKLRHLVGAGLGM